MGAGTEAAGQPSRMSGIEGIARFAKFQPNSQKKAQLLQGRPIQADAQATRPIDGAEQKAGGQSEIFRHGTLNSW